MGNTRKTGKEQYYTRPEIVELCLDELNDLGLDHLIVEPCGGYGNFLEGLLQREYLVKSWDIEPHHPAITKGSWFDTNKIDEPFSVITNPPFGRMNKLSVKFFNHSAELGASYIAFLIPISWRKWSTMNRLNKNYRLIKDVNLPDDHLFYGDDVDTSKKNILKCVFQIWKKSDIARNKIEYSDKSLIRANSINADIQIIQQGWSTGKVNRIFDRNKSVAGTCYYKANGEMINRLEHLQKVDAYASFKRNSAYVDSISYSEICYLLR